MAKPAVKAQARAFLLWRVASPAGWNLTIREAAALAGIPAAHAREVARGKGWTSRFRPEQREASHASSAYADASDLMVRTRSDEE